MSSRIPKALAAGILAVLGGAGYYLADQEAAVAEMSRNAYVQAVRDDAETTPAVKAAMVMGAYYESSYRHIGTPYVDKLGKGQPLTVCNGITGAAVRVGRVYTPAECYALERTVYRRNEAYLLGDVPQWATLTVLQQATFIDFLHNKGQGNWATSTMRSQLLAGATVQACRQNERWNRGTVNGVSTVLPGLKVRGDANADICERGLR